MEAQTLLEKVEDSRPIEMASRVYTLLARAFSFPADELHRLFRKEGMAEEMKEMMEGLPFKLEFKGISPISRSQDDIEILYTNYFDMPMCPCPLYESYHRRGDVAREDVREELLRFYEHFGIGPSEKNRDYPDHLVAELEFMAYLSRKEAGAVKEGKETSQWRIAQRDFLARHLSRWVKRLNKVIQSKVIDEPFYKGMSSFMVEFTGSHLKDLNQSIKKIEKERR